MNITRPGTLAVRAVNQYRRRDVFTYLSLRYYLCNTAARADLWSTKVATNLVLTRTSQPYFRTHHFKDVTPQTTIGHRVMFLPCANEVLAEAALLAECAKHPHAFANPERVFSYALSQNNERSGVFQHYIGGLRDRHQAIAEACDACPNGIVQYTDIQRFYPSITTELALSAWRKQADIAKLPPTWFQLGEKLIEDHEKTGVETRQGILTGPMFSHLIGNLVLREIDERCLCHLPAQYFRYVDDITFVGEKDAVFRSVEMLRNWLNEIGLNLHKDDSPKSLEVPVSEWLKGRNDYGDSRREISWPSLIGDLKKFLLQNPGAQEELKNAFQNEGFRIPVRDYSGAVHESSCLERIIELAKRPWYRCKSANVCIDSLLVQARFLRTHYADEFLALMDGAEKLEGYEKKRHIPKLRYRAARLIYLAPDDTLTSFSHIAREVPDLYFHAMLMEAVSSGNVDNVICMGTNAAQAAAQPLRASGKGATTKLHKYSFDQEQGLAVFSLNGVHVENQNKALKTESEIIRFAKTGVDIGLMKSEDHFMREISCLHGLTGQPRHPDLLDFAFDEDEELTMDAIDQLQRSLSP